MCGPLLPKQGNAPPCRSQLHSSWWNLAGKSWTWQHWVRPYPPALASDESESNGRGSGRKTPLVLRGEVVSGSNGENRFRGTWEWQHPIPYTPTMVLEPYGSQHTRRQVGWDPLANCPKKATGSPAVPLYACLKPCPTFVVFRRQPCMEGRKSNLTNSGKASKVWHCI